ncbi:hypothetical protein MPTK1_2g13040 [Marchantia polymorpha subsp. ruderalis]|uniref:F-box domain-containing protein n=1 Tax=Marchantia polymorpha TaxID=3197 RepID=A0A2R6XAQ8_MARPO|nr:hypothetical protein MARPO_0026s0068 [Marchantia polymorpha]BBN02129.1 hypothetical protein Mp_2g13040 [Marchantia polymorpha subsp. ruderalis]|eukprot:PTQ43193.1 hypothetical protein MARPO_0026s0068 [Marchantia polymorpha]
MSALSAGPSSKCDCLVQKRRLSRAWISSLIPGLPDDVVRGCLARLSRSSWIHLRLVSKAWKRAVEDPFFFQCRVDLGVTEEWVYSETWNPTTKVVSWYALDVSEEKWLCLPPIPTRRGLDHEVFGRASISVKGELYVAGGQAGKSGPTLRDVYIYSPFTHQWRKGKSMITTRHSPLIFLVDRQIYVTGGFDSFGNLIQVAEKYDAEKKEWSTVGNRGFPEVICPNWYKRGWQVQWSSYTFDEDEFYISYRTKDSQQATKQLIKFYVPKKGEWFLTRFKDKVKALVTFSLGATVNKHIVLVDWATGRLRYTYHPCRSVGWAKVQGLAELDWVTILTSNPKAAGLGSKLVLVGRGLNVLMIETDPILVTGDDIFTSISSEPGAEDEEVLNCVILRA